MNGKEYELALDKYPDSKESAEQFKKLCKLTKEIQKTNYVMNEKEYALILDKHPDLKESIERFNKLCELTKEMPRTRRELAVTFNCSVSLIASLMKEINRYGEYIVNNGDNTYSFIGESVYDITWIPKFIFMVEECTNNPSVTIMEDLELMKLFDVDRRMIQKLRAYTLPQRNEFENILRNLTSAALWNDAVSTEVK